MSLTNSINYDITSTTPAANATVRRIPTSGFRIIKFTLLPAGTVNYTVKFVQSDQETEPDFAAAVSSTNLWNYVEVVDLDSGADINGSTGIALSSTSPRTFEVNINNSRWFGILCTAYTSGTVSGNFLLTNNQ